jgi:hypothetical protein
MYGSKQVAGYSQERVMEARKMRLLGRISRCVRVCVALAKSGAPAERGDRKGEKREERLRRWQELPELPHKNRVVRVLSRASTCPACVVFQVASNQSLCPFSKTVACLLSYLLLWLLLSTFIKSRDSRPSNNDDNLERRSAELIPVCRGQSLYYALD